MFIEFLFCVFLLVVFYYFVNSRSIDGNTETTMIKPLKLDEPLTIDQKSDEQLELNKPIELDKPSSIDQKSDEQLELDEPIELNKPSIIDQKSDEQLELYEQTLELDEPLRMESNVRCGIVENVNGISISENYFIFRWTKTDQDDTRQIYRDNAHTSLIKTIGSSTLIINNLTHVSNDDVSICSATLKTYDDSLYWILQINGIVTTNLPNGDTLNMDDTFEIITNFF
jgi:hypothetical protein